MELLKNQQNRSSISVKVKQYLDLHVLPGVSLK